LLAGASARPGSHALGGLVGGPARAAPVEPPDNCRLLRCGCARDPCRRPPSVLSMQTWATPRAHVLVGASHRRRVPLRQRPCLFLPKRVPQAPKVEGDTRPPDELAGPWMQCTSRWVSRQRAARARPPRGCGTAPRGQDLAALAGGSRNVFRRPRKTRATRAPPTSWPTPGCSAPRGGCRGNVQPGRGRNAAAERRREGKIWRLTPERPAWSDETGAYAACVPPQDVRVPPIACAWRLGGHVGRSPPLTQPRKCCHPFPRRILLCPVPAHAPHRQVHTHHPPTHAHTRPTASPAAPPASSITAAVRQAPRCMPATPTRARRARPHAPTGCCSPRPPRREGGSAVRYHSGIWRIQNSRRQACRISRPRHLHFNRGEHGDAAVGAYGRTWPSAVGRGCPHVTPPKRRPRTPTAGHDHRSNVRAPADSIGPAPKPELA